MDFTLTPGPLGDAWDEPDTGVPPCIFCRRTIPCECSTVAEREAGDETCMCTCGRCEAPHPVLKSKSVR